MLSQLIIGLKFNPYTSSMLIFSLFYFQYHSFPSAAAILTGFTKKVAPPGKSSSRYERTKNKQVAVLLSIQKARKRYTLIGSALVHSKGTKTLRSLLSLLEHFRFW